jgi:hypothetical protein
MSQAHSGAFEKSAKIRIATESYENCEVHERKQVAAQEENCQPLTRKSEKGRATSSHPHSDDFDVRARVHPAPCTSGPRKQSTRNKQGKDNVSFPNSSLQQPQALAHGDSGATCITKACNAQPTPEPCAQQKSVGHRQGGTLDGKSSAVNTAMCLQQSKQQVASPAHLVASRAGTVERSPADDERTGAVTCFPPAPWAHLPGISAGLNMTDGVMRSLGNASGLSTVLPRCLRHITPSMSFECQQMHWAAILHHVTA